MRLKEAPGVAFCRSEGATVQDLYGRIIDAHPCRPRHPACRGIDPAHLEGLWLHPWLRARLLLRMLVSTSWEPEKLELLKRRGAAVAREIRALERSPWFN